MNGFAVIEFVVVAAIIIVAFRVRGKKHAGGRKVNGGNTSISLKPTEIVIGGSIHSLDGVQAELAQQSKSRTTASRVAAGTAIAPGLGTLAGAMSKKGTTNNVLVVTGPNWSKTVAFRDIGRATLAARMINEAAAGHTNGGA
jgi:hypothetical protein